MNGKQAMQTQQTQHTVGTVTDLINQMKPAFQMALGTPQMAERFCRVALTQVRLNAKLAQCSQTSLMGSLMMAAQLKLEFNLGSAYIIPYYSTRLKGYEAQFQIGYQGYIDLFYRHPLAEELYAEVVYQNDEFKIIKGTKREIVHNPVLDDNRGDPVGYYAVARLKTGAYNFAYMSVADAQKHMRRYSRADQSGKYGVWSDNFDEMALKTCIKKALKLMPKSVEIVSAFEMDEAVKRPPTIEAAMDISSIPSLFASDDEDAQQIEQKESPEVGHNPEHKPRQSKSKTPPPEPQPESSSDPLSRAKVDMITKIKNYDLAQEEEDDWVNAINNAPTVADVYKLESLWYSQHPHTAAK